MAVTRINNNQISDASAGNAYVGINAAVKLQNYSVTATKIANNLTYGSDLTITGNLTIQGNTTTVDTTYTTIEDPVILLASNQTGSPAVDIGFIGERGTSQNIAFVWDESASEFVTVFTNDAETNTTVSIASYASFHTKDANIGGNLVVNGNASVVGTVVGNVAFAGNITMGNVLTNGQVSAAGNVTGGNLLTSGLVSAASHIGSVVSVTANITGGNLLTGGLISATSNITSAANIAGGNVLATTIVSGASVLGSIVSASGNVTGGNINTGGIVSSTGNIISAANVSGGNLVATTAVVTPTVIGTTVTVSSTGGLITLAPSSNVSVNNKYINSLADPVQDQDAATKIYVDNMVSTALTYHTSVLAATTGTLETATGGTITYAQPNGAGNGVGATLTVSGGTFNLIDTANIQTANTRVLVKNQANAVLNGVYIWSNATVLTRSTDADSYGPNSTTDLSINDYFFVTSGNVNAGSAWVVDAPSGTITFGTSNITFAQFSSSQTYTANTSAGISITGTVISAKVDNNTTAFDGGGNIIVKASANLTTPNIGAATGTSLSVTGNLTGAGANISGNVSGGNLLTAGLISSTGNITSVANITGGNLLTSGIVSAASHIGSVVSVTGNITGGNLLTAGLISSTGNITSAANVAGGNLITTGLATVTGNVIGGNLTTAGQVTATGNITGGNVNATSFVGTVVSMSGNITGANLNTGGSNGLTLNASTINSNAGRITINSAVADVDFAVSGLTANVFYVDAGTATASFGNSTQTTNSLVSFNSNRSIVIPKGLTSERPDTGVTGMIRFNTTTNSVEVYDNSTWTAVGVPTFTVVADDQFVGDGVQTAFTLSASSYTTNSVIVSINGVVQIPTSAYSVSGATLTFTEAPQTGDLIDVRELVTTTQVTSISNSPGNAVIATNATINEVSVTGNVVPVSNATQSLGSATNTWKSLYVAGNTIYLGGLQLQSSGNTFVVYTADGVTQANIDVGSIDVSAITSGTTAIGISTTNGNAYVTVGGTANVAVWSTAGQYITGLISASGNITSAANIAGGNLAITSAATATSVSASGTITGGTLISTGTISVAGNIVSTASNATANIGSATTYFNTVHAKATSAQYADLAENYAADAEYVPGTVLSFGGSNEVTVSTIEGDRRIAGVVSTNPSYIMNSVLEAEHVVTIALTGRVPTFVSGPVEKGDMMVSGGNGRAVACATPAIGTVIGKALENHTGGDGVIEVVVGRL